MWSGEKVPRSGTIIASTIGAASQLLGSSLGMTGKAFQGFLLGFRAIIIVLGRPRSAISTWVHPCLWRSFRIRFPKRMSRSSAITWDHGLSFFSDKSDLRNNSCNLKSGPKELLQPSVMAGGCLRSGLMSLLDDRLTLSAENRTFQCANRQVPYCCCSC
jgi:hypothetical protein